MRKGEAQVMGNKSLTLILLLLGIFILGYIVYIVLKQLFP